MTIPPFADESRSGLVPLFPLPAVTLLPGELYALYVFEPRYRQLLEDVERGEKLIGLARFQPGWEDAYYANPRVHPCIGVGRVVASRRRPDGTSNVVLRGLARVRLLEVVRSMPYRLARVDDLPATVSSTERLAEMVADIDDLLRAGSGPGADGLSALDAPLEELAGRIAADCAFGPDEKQRMLEADDLVERLGLVRRHLAREARGERVARLLAGGGTALALRN